MTAQPLNTTPRLGLNTATVSLILAIAIQFAIVVANGARVEAQVTDLRATTEPLRRGDLVAIQRDVAWIRENMERERPR
jgi:hypothetical protein